ncbi:MAG TPA: CotH kinase family protein [Symbiobacteriaceae bacterium]|nr:CotH kinase family protein [Symbiobacteriaceae bacterium]
MPVPVSELELDAADVQWLRSHRGTPRCFTCTLQAGAETHSGWIGFRGRYSRWFRKPSFDLWFDPSSPSGGLRRVHLNAAYRDPSLLRGRLALDLFAALGVPVPRCRHIWLRLNGRDLGVYTEYESLDAGWLSRNGFADGPIYYAVGDQGNFGLIDPDTGRPKRYMIQGYEKSHPGDDDFSDLHSLIRQITLPDDPEFAAEIGEVIDVENCLRWLVGVLFMSHTDGLVQNYALFRPGQAKWLISPWDCDGTFGRGPGGGRLGADYLPPDHGQENYLVARLLQTEFGRRRFREIMAEALSGALAAERVLERMESIYGEIRPEARADPLKRYSNTTFRRERGLIRTYVEERTRLVKQALGL